MTVVLVHGVPETAAVWDLLVEQLVRLGHPEPVRLSPPGFGSSVPAGWPATVKDYRNWLIDQLEVAGQPVDLVGHDWGGGHVLNVAMHRPDLLRSWVCDVPGLFDPEYQWHNLAKQWQRLGEGEEAITALTTAPLSVRAQILVDAGMNPITAGQVAAGIDEAMGSCILRLYRSAAQPAVARLGRNLEAASARPGLALLATEDHQVGTDEQRRQSADRAGARTEVLEGLGHWWMTQDPQRGAAALHEFWDSLH